MPLRRLAYRMDTATLLACEGPAVESRPTLPEDDLLVEAARAGSSAALENLAARYRTRLYGFSLMLLRRPDDAEDVAQEPLVRAFASLHTYRRRGSFRGWLFRIASNLCRDRQRREYVRTEHASTETLEALGRVPDPSDQVALRTALASAVDRLPLHYRAAVVLHYMEELSVPEVAEALGRSAATVRMQLWRARNLLARDAALTEWREESERRPEDPR